MKVIPKIKNAILNNDIKSMNKLITDSSFDLTYNNSFILNYALSNSNDAFIELSNNNLDSVEKKLGCFLKIAVIKSNLILTEFLLNYNKNFEIKHTHSLLRRAIRLNNYELFNLLSKDKRFDPTFEVFELAKEFKNINILKILIKTHSIKDIISDNDLKYTQNLINKDLSKKISKF
jgi:hypothetical protein